MQTALEILTHPALAPVRHGFFTRKGGASSGLFAGLNCGRGSSDQKEVVAINRARVAAALGLPPERLATVNQTHSDKVVTLTGSEDLDAVARTEADAIVTAVPGLAIAVLTADCAPVLLADREAGVVGAAHASAHRCGVQGGQRVCADVGRPVVHEHADALAGAHGHEP